MRYVENRRRKPNHYAATPKAKRLRAEYLNEVASDVRKSLRGAAIKGFNALTRLLGPDSAAELRRRRKARTREPYVLGNVQGVRMTIPGHGLKHRHA